MSLALPLSPTTGLPSDSNSEVKKGFQGSEVLDLGLELR